MPTTVHSWKEHLNFFNHQVWQVQTAQIRISLCFMSEFTFENEMTNWEIWNSVLFRSTPTQNSLAWFGHQETGLSVHISKRKFYNKSSTHWYVNNTAKVNFDLQDDPSTLINRKRQMTTEMSTDSTTQDGDVTSATSATSQDDHNHHVNTQSTNHNELSQHPRAKQLTLEKVLVHRNLLWEFIKIPEEKMPLDFQLRSLDNRNMSSWCSISAWLTCTCLCKWKREPPKHGA